MNEFIVQELWSYCLQCFPSCHKWSAQDTNSHPLSWIAGTLLRICGPLIRICEICGTQIQRSGTLVRIRETVTRFCGPPIDFALWSVPRSPRPSMRRIWDRCRRSSLLLDRAPRPKLDAEERKSELSDRIDQMQRGDWQGACNEQADECHSGSTHKSSNGYPPFREQASAWCAHTRLCRGESSVSLAAIGNFVRICNPTLLPCDFASQIRGFGRFFRRGSLHCACTVHRAPCSRSPITAQSPTTHRRFPFTNTITTSAAFHFGASSYSPVNLPKYKHVNDIVQL